MRSLWWTFSRWIPGSGCRITVLTVFRETFKILAISRSGSPCFFNVRMACRVSWAIMGSVPLDSLLKMGKSTLYPIYCRTEVLQFPGFQIRAKKNRDLPSQTLQDMTDHLKIIEPSAFRPRMKNSGFLFLFL